jgi:hypothetical protein
MILKDMPDSFICQAYKAAIFRIDGNHWNLVFQYEIAAWIVFCPQITRITPFGREIAPLSFRGLGLVKDY